jgi:hypothetical protein
LIQTVKSLLFGGFRRNGLWAPEPFGLLSRLQTGGYIVL